MTPHEDTWGDMFEANENRRDLEQAVLDAARALVEHENRGEIDGAGFDRVLDAIHDAVRALDGGDQ